MRYCPFVVSGERFRSIRLPVGFSHDIQKQGRAASVISDEALNFLAAFMPDPNNLDPENFI